MRHSLTVSDVSDDAQPQCVGESGSTRILSAIERLSPTYLHQTVTRVPIPILLALDLPSIFVPRRAIGSGSTPSLMTAITPARPLIGSSALNSRLFLAAPEAVLRFACTPNALQPVETGDEFEARFRRDADARRRASVETPFAPEVRQALFVATEEAGALGHHAITPEHLLLGLLNDETTAAHRKLNASGVILHAVRDAMAKGE